MGAVVTLEHGYVNVKVPSGRLRGTEIVTVPLDEATGTLKTVPPELYEVAEVFFG